MGVGAWRMLRTGMWLACYSVGVLYGVRAHESKGMGMLIWVGCGAGVCCGCVTVLR